MHPLGKSPVVTDGDGHLRRVGRDRGSTWLVDRYGNGRLCPPTAGTPERRRWSTEYFLHYAEGSAMPPLLLKLVFDRASMSCADATFFVRSGDGARIAGKVKSTFRLPQLVETHLSFLEGGARPRPWFAGDEFTAADIQMSFPRSCPVARAGLTASTRPKLHARARAHPRAAGLCPRPRRRVDRTPGRLCGGVAMLGGRGGADPPPLPIPPRCARCTRAISRRGGRSSPGRAASRSCRRASSWWSTPAAVTGSGAEAAFVKAEDPGRGVGPQLVRALDAAGKAELLALRR